MPIVPVGLVRNALINEVDVLTAINPSGVYMTVTAVNTYIARFKAIPFIASRSDVALNN